MSQDAADQAVAGLRTTTTVKVMVEKDEQGGLGFSLGSENPSNITSITPGNADVFCVSCVSCVSCVYVCMCVCVSCVRETLTSPHPPPSLNPNINDPALDCFGACEQMGLPTRPACGAVTLCSALTEKTSRPFHTLLLSSDSSLVVRG